jgi:multiple sugar transport system permease protein
MTANSATTTPPRKGLFRRNMAPRQRMSKAARREAIEGYLFLLPNFLGFIVFMAIPLLLSLYYSFTNYDLFNDPTWVGTANYQKALGFTLQPEKYQAAIEQGKSVFDSIGQMIKTNDPLFWTSLGNTIVFALGVLLLSVPTAFYLAWLLNSKIRGMVIFRGLFYIPVVAAIVGVALVWFWIFQRDNGVLNTLISGIVNFLNSIITPLGLKPIEDPMIGWLTDPNWAMVSLIIMRSWQTIGYNMVIFLAALQGVPVMLFEAALVDGATRNEMLRKIVVPLLTPSIFFVVVTTLINGLQIFAEPYIMTAGGPANSTITLVYYLYQKGFQRFQMGYGASLAWLAFGIIFAITTVQFRLSKRWVYEE